MNLTQDQLSDLFQNIKHRGVELHQAMALDLVNSIKSKYDTKTFGITLLCISYGSSYIEDHEPNLFETLMKNHTIACYDLGDLFECIRMTQLTHLYLDTLLHYANHEIWDFNEFEQHSCAVEALGNHIYRTKDEDTYTFIYQQAEASIAEALKHSNDQESIEDYLFKTMRYIKALFFALEGSKSYMRPRVKFLELNTILKKVPNTLINK